MPKRSVDLLNDCFYTCKTLRALVSVLTLSRSGICANAEPMILGLVSCFNCIKIQARAVLVDTRSFQFAVYLAVHLGQARLG